MRLGLARLGMQDTATAISELALATQLAGDEPHVRYVTASSLASLASTAPRRLAS